MTVEEELALLRAENQELKRLLAQALERIIELEERLAELQQSHDDRPSFVKPNRRKVKEPNKPRKKRDSRHNHGRHREEPTRTIKHALDRCPDCNYGLEGESVDYTRQVIELPNPDAPLQASDALILIGRDVDLARLASRST